MFVFLFLLDREEAVSEPIFERRFYMNPNDTRQYLYRLTPITSIDINLKVSRYVLIQWRINSSDTKPQLFS